MLNKELKLYTLFELTEFGICRTELYNWKNKGWLVPFTYSGSRAKYRYDDFIEACNKARQATVNNNPIIDKPINDFSKIRNAFLR